MNNLPNKSSSEFLAGEIKKGYRATQGCSIIVLIIAGLFFIIKVLPTLL